ncbi:hypothetical protein GA0061099_1006527 [Bradyrhizobium yuanmingense]|uniref:Uncharacterized protein n=1 Tax=Bradyrhizobium yuanmingense TaxID=108015 RepID=A0A1C3WN21_9BRAD|nr:hypothetical protein IQ15_04234 [Bradyrhizobium yuanmingense]SCB41369.1 hypothetical protein GA0061099_1006527 [Bradyrhizobium yuanmingense]
MREGSNSLSPFLRGEGWGEGLLSTHEIFAAPVPPHPDCARAQSDLSPQAGRGEESHLAPNVVLPNSAFCVDGCERQYCGGASTTPPSSAAACQPQRGS